MKNFKRFEILPNDHAVDLNMTADNTNPSPNLGAGLNLQNKSDYENNERTEYQENKTALTTSIVLPIGYQIPVPPAAWPTVTDMEENSAPTDHQLCQGPPRPTMCAPELEPKLAQDEVPVNQAEHGREFTQTTPITKQDVAMDLPGDIMAGSARKGRSGVKAKVKPKVEKAMTMKNLNRWNKMRKDVQNITATRTNKISKTTHKITPGEILNGTERHQRILWWIKQCSQSLPFLHATMRKTPPPSPNILANLAAGRGSTDRNPVKPTAKPARPILGPKADAGITKKYHAGRLTAHTQPEAKAKGDVGEGPDSTAGVSKNASFSKVTIKQTMSPAAVKTMSLILKRKDGAGVTKKITQPDLLGPTLENATTNCPKPRNPKRKGRVGGKRRTATERINQETKVLMLKLEFLKSVDAELSRQITLYRGTMKAEDTSASVKSPTQEASSDTALSHGIFVAKSKDAIEERGMEGVIFGVGSDGDVPSIENDSL
ncbi:unnamed protein product [Tuber aestivum]|uniref:Uncharacterized protein n=1 Tax=Tuber aestivum TaxID=59557 RepID=A0A292PXR2_9PEZI|nr:unnamed protein product [Tuber aestivum]